MSGSRRELDRRKRLFGRVSVKIKVASSRIARSKILVLSYTLALLAIFASENFEQIAEKIWGQSVQEWKSLQPAFLYQEVTNAGYRRPRPHYVRLVTFDPVKEPQWLQGSECNSRLFEARLLDALSRSHPALIVLDEYFPVGDCIETDSTANAQTQDPTKELQASVNRLTTMGIPVVIADYSLNYEEQLEFMSKGKLNPKGRHLEPSEILLQPRVHFDRELEEGVEEQSDKPRPLVTFGAAHRDEDSRRIPINWAEYPSQDDLDARVGDYDSTHGPFEILGLAAQAASVYDSSPRFQNELLKLRNAKEDPFTSFLPEKEFTQFESLDVLCGNAHVRSDTNWKSCKPSDYAMSQLSGHIILVGDASEDDTHMSVLGNVYGYLLVANYIESLLDDRVLFPVPWPVELGTSFVLFIAIWLIFRRWKLSPVKALVAAILLILASYFLCYLVVLVLGYYMYVWIPSIVALIGETISLFMDQPPKKRHQRTAPSNRKVQPV